MTDLSQTPTEVREYYIASSYHTQSHQHYITFWRPENAGYCWPLSWAGKYTAEQVRDQFTYYNSERSLAVPVDVVERFGLPPAPRHVDGDAGPVVPNNPAIWQALKAAQPTLAAIEAELSRRQKDETQ